MPGGMIPPGAGGSGNPAGWQPPGGGGAGGGGGSRNFGGDQVCNVCMWGVDELSKLSQTYHCSLLHLFPLGEGHGRAHLTRVLSTLRVGLRLPTAPV